MARAGRPLSPHLQIYRMQLAMVLSGAHRISGVALAAGLLLLAWWILALAAGPESFATVQAVMDNFLGVLVLFGFTFALLYHLCNGIRHLAWDAGYGFEPDVALRSGVAVLAVSIGLTVLVWIAVVIVG